MIDDPHLSGDGLDSIDSDRPAREMDTEWRLLRELRFVLPGYRVACPAAWFSR